MTFGVDFGALGAGAMSLIGARNANRATRALAREQMGFQERMSNTAYQRMSEDMRKAGLNPILGLNSGGASSPAGATAQMQNELSGALASAVEVRRANAEVENLRSQNRLINAEARLKSAQVPLEELKAEGVQVASKAAHSIVDAVKNHNYAHSAKTVGTTFKDFLKKFNTFTRYFNR